MDRDRLEQHGWIIGQSYGVSLYYPEPWVGAFLFHNGAVVCCNDDELRLTDINEAGQIVGAWYQGVYGTVDQFGTYAPIFDWWSVVDIPANA